MNFFKNKYKGYVLLLTMIIISSIFLLVIKIISKNSLVNSTAKTISIKHEQNILFASAVSIVKSLLSFDELNKNQKKINNQNKEIKDVKEIKTESKEAIETKEESKDINLPLLFFNFYWKECNKWLEYKFFNNKYNLNGTISIYLSIEDGKFPLKNLYIEYEKEINKDKKDIDITESKNTDNKNNTLNTDPKNDTENIEKQLEKNNFLQKIKTIFKKYEEKNSIFNKINSNNKKKSDLENNKDSFIFKLINKYFKKGNTKIPFLLIDALNDESLQNENIYGDLTISKNNPKKSYGLQDCYSLSNNNCSLSYISPALIEFIGQKAIQLNNETRTKIIESGKKYFDKSNSSEIKNEDLWNALYSKNLNIEYQKEFFDINDTRKIYNSKIDIPSGFSALIKIEILNRTLFGIAFFEKNLKYVNNNKDSYNQNQQYLISSIYILPFE